MKLMESEVKLLVINYLKPDGYHNFTFEWLIKPKKSNIWQCIVKADKTLLWFDIDDNAKQILGSKPLRKHHKMVFNETVTHKDHLKVTTEGVRKIQDIRTNALLIGLWVISLIVGYFIQFPIGLIAGFLIGSIPFVISSSVITRERFRDTYEK